MENEEGSLHIRMVANGLFIFKINIIISQLEPSGHIPLIAESKKYLGNCILLDKKILIITMTDIVKKILRH